MSESLKRAVRIAVLRLLDPLARLLLEVGIGVGEFLSIAKVAYVRAAREQGEEGSGAGRRPNATRIAVLTGLTRVEVAAILAAGDGEPPSSDRGRQRAERVLTGWWNDPEFQDEVGRPAPLAERGARRSFASLCERYSGEQPQQARVAILAELLRVRAVKRMADGRVVAMSRTYATVGWDPGGVLSAGEELADHCEALLRNLQNPTRPRLIRRVINSQLEPRYAPMLIRDLEQQANTMADAADDALNDPQHRARTAEGALRVGIGLYIIEGPAESAPDSRETSEQPKSRARGRGARSRRGGS
jgi:hypothetical protein